MKNTEYTDGYEPEHPELIPKNPEQAQEWIKAAIEEGITKCPKRTFLQGWWALAWLTPGFHPDDCENWTELPNAIEFTEEARRRVQTGEIDGDSEYYATEAVHNAVWLLRSGNPNAPTA